VLGRSYSDPQEGLSGFFLFANREVSVTAATAATPTVTTVTSKRNFMMSIFGSVSGFACFTLRVRARESLTGIHLLLSSQHSSRASPKRTYLPECPEKLQCRQYNSLEDKSTDFYFVSRQLGRITLHKSLNYKSLSCNIRFLFSNGLPVLALGCR
jgi:hypothetical protein